MGKLASSVGKTTRVNGYAGHGIERKRLGEDRFFSGAFGVFCHFLLFFVRFVWWY